MTGIENIKKIGVIGSGTMGSGIVSACALKGFKVIVYDINDDALMRSKKNIVSGYDKLVEKGKLDRTGASTAENNILCVTDFAELADCDLVIEAAIENIDLKKQLFSRLEEITKESAIFATNTSSFSVTAISTALKNNRGRVVGMHFFNPANIMKLVEVVKGEFTTDDVLNTVTALAVKLGKVPVTCSDTPAFIVNRVARAFYGESLKIMGEEDLTAEVIDSIMKEEGGFAMGPFELMDLIGIDVNLSVTKSVYEAFFYDQKYKPSPIQQKMVDSGLLGRKTKQGFYKY
jgi:3-hydroxybutyryl-CoA dehydrogenase